MKNSKETPTNRTNANIESAATPQLDLWLSSPAPAALENVKEPIERKTSRPRSEIQRKNSIQVPDLEKKTSAAPAPRGRWPTRHGVRTATVDKTERAPFGVPIKNVPALTRRQHDLLDYLRRRREQGLLPPSLTEICRDLGLVSRGSLHKQVMALVRADLVEPMQGKQRGVRLLEGPDEHGQVPLLGAIAAGRPIEAVLRQERVEVPQWLSAGRSCYALKVKGDSMRDAGILDGDVVLVEPRVEVRNGETVVALIDGEEATLKRIEQHPGEVLLFPENSAHTVQRYTPDRVAVQGVVIGALRRY